MSACQTCWDDAHGRARIKGTHQVDEYRVLLIERADNQCPGTVHPATNRRSTPMTTTQDTTAETDGQLLTRLGTDATQWAAAYAKTTADHTSSEALDPTPGGLLHVWFANAIEAGRSAGYSAAQAEIDELRGKLDGANACWQRAQAELDTIHGDRP